MWLLLFQRLALEFVFDVLLFPVWWYTQGALTVLKTCAEAVKNANLSMAPVLWLQNLFVPMYGQYDWQGRLMSVFMRLANVVIRSIGLFLYSIAVFLLFLVWLAVPPFVCVMLYVSLF